MTKKELLAKIDETNHSEWFASVSLTLNFPTAGVKNKNLTGFTAIFLYFQQQKEGWEDIADIPEILKNTSSEYFINQHRQLIKFLRNAKEWDKDELGRQWSSHLSYYRNAQNNFNRLTYDSPETDFLLALHEEQPIYVEDVFNFLMAFRREHINRSANTIPTPNNTKSFIAYTIAYEFLQRDYTEITRRYDSEKSSLSKLRNDYSNYLSDSEAHLKEVLEQATKDGEEYAQNIDNIKTEKEKAFNDWYDKSKQEITDLKNTYENLLKLQEPANYWKQRAQKLKQEGDKHNKWLKGISIGGVLLAVGVLFCFSNGIMAGIFEKTGIAIKWSIAFITFVSLLAFGIKHLSKLTLSAYHLARDAEEKEQLTYLFLALHKDSAVNSREREIVLQSLFSRADSGLLKDESSPTMPGNVMGFLEKIAKTK